MSASKTPRQAFTMSRRHALAAPAAALLAASLGPALLAACGGGGDGGTPIGGGGVTPQSLMIGPIAGLGSIIVNGVRFDDSTAQVSNDEDGSGHPSRDLKLGMMVEVESSRINDATGTAKAAVIRFGSEMRSEERRVGKECIPPCRSRWSPYH